MHVCEFMCVQVHVCLQVHIYMSMGGHLRCLSSGAVPFFCTLRLDLTETWTLLFKLCCLVSKAQGPVLSLLSQLAVCHNAQLLYVDSGIEPRFSFHICARR